MKKAMMNFEIVSIRQAVMLLIGALALLLLLTGCSDVVQLFEGGAKKPAEPIEVLKFTYSHNGMSMEDCYTATFEPAPGGGTHVQMELVGGAYTVDEVLDEDYMSWLSELATQYRMDKWDGFDKVDKRVLDGEGFDLYMELADGRTVSAHGSNAYPKNFDECISQVETLIQELGDAYSDRYPKEVLSDDLHYFRVQFRSDNDGVKRFEVSCTDEGEEFALKIHIQNREDLMEGCRFEGTCVSFPFEEVQAVIRKHDIPQWNGWKLYDEDGENFNLEAEYESGETIEAYGSVHPENYDAFCDDITAVLMEFITENMDSFIPYGE